VGYERALVDLYSAFLTTAPFILLAVSGGVTFGPVPATGRHSAWRLPKWQLANDLAVVAIVISGAAVSLLVLGDVLTPNEIVRSSVVTGGLLALFLLLLHAAADVVRMYRSPKGGQHTGAANEDPPLSLPRRPGVASRPGSTSPAPR
jgi:uncharacterized BrkB/YihY/UPF0761 family membrane protein